jgi:uncharacterized Tic20 family protein
LADQPIFTSLPLPTQEERTMAFFAHLLQIFTGFMGPLVILVIKQNSPFVKFHALQALMWQLCYMAFFLSGFAFVFFAAFVGVFHEISRPHNPSTFPAFFLLFPLLWLFAVGGWVANVILGAVYGIKANRGEWASYPIIGKWCLAKLAPVASTAPPPRFTS